MYHILIKFKIQ